MSTDDRTHLISADSVLFANDPGEYRSLSVTSTLRSQWFAVWTKSRQEKVVAAMLRERNIEHFLPLKTETRQWSDRKKEVSTPLFNGYVFVRLELLHSDRLRVLSIPGVAGLVGNSKGPAPIPDHQINGISAVLNSGLDHSIYPFLDTGSQVRVIRGPLTGTVGMLIHSNSEHRLMISVDLIHRSVSVSVSRESVALIEDMAPDATIQMPHLPPPSMMTSNRSTTSFARN